MKLDKKVAIVTGGANGIGRSIVEQLLKENVIVHVFDYNKTALDKLKKEFETVKITQCDVTNVEEVKTSINSVLEESKSIDILINNAGIIHNSPIFGFSSEGFKIHDIDMWKKTIDVDLNSVFYMSAHVVEKMVMNRFNGVIINISSICSAGNAGQSAYSAAKAGVNALTITWAKELAPYGIRVTGIAPGFTKTQNCLDSMSEPVIEEWEDKTPLRRMATPEEIADSALFIIKNDFYNGRILEIDGGLRM